MPVVAVLCFTFASARVLASLHDDGTWTATDSTAAAVLNATLDPRDEQGPLHGAFGMAAVARAVAKYQAAVVWARPAEHTQDVCTRPAERTRPQQSARRTRRAG
jgi:hypothetical protein